MSTTSRTVHASRRLHGQRLEVELFNPDRIEQAAQTFLRDGFVAIADALDASQLRRVQAGCARVIAEQTAATPVDQANRGLARYSFGQQIQHSEWAMLVDLPTVLPIIDRIWGSEDYTSIGGGGDYCLPGAQMQGLHSDLGDHFKDPLGQIDCRDVPTPFIVVNFPMVDFSEANGATRFVPGTQRSRANIPSLADEPEWMRRNLLCVPAGSALIRDVRCWHGGTPNTSQQIRPMASTGYHAPWFRALRSRDLPRAVHATLSPRGQRLTDLLVGD
ncbi:MAG: phytanoyl-CoA dioxygenase family protein [Planctomycetes bacterium]|nr:phytanoyl-CoA dioxygenase family protein [Planctomycetota bacterium]